MKGNRHYEIKIKQRRGIRSSGVGSFLILNRVARLDLVRSSHLSKEGRGVFHADILVKNIQAEGQLM